MKKESKYQAVASLSQKGIESGNFQHSHFPIRQLSQDFHCSKDTVQRELHEQYPHAKPAATMF